MLWSIEVHSLILCNNFYRKLKNQENRESSVKNLGPDILKILNQNKNFHAKFFSIESLNGNYQKEKLK